LWPAGHSCDLVPQVLGVLADNTLLAFFNFIITMINKFVSQSIEVGMSLQLAINAPLSKVWIQ
jgi:hypothetical protein